MARDLVDAHDAAVAGARDEVDAPVGFQVRAVERQVRVSHGEAIRRDRLEAVTALACAASDHRRAMWMRGDAILKGVGTDRIEALRGESHMTRSAITRPLVTLRVLIEDQTVRAAADRRFRASAPQLPGRC
ncbi:hypothetical protein [Streptomyces sp. NPDC006309]|uniref:hypothetical protein n=1 Tax=Streptomyces sp. NPDC006309 TaxID=3156749 RepID=UPI0033B19FC2